MQNALWGALDRPNLAISRQRYDSITKSKWVSELAQIVGSNQVWTQREKLFAYSYDATGERHLPDVVVFLTRTQDIGPVLKVLKAHDIPVLGRGAGTNLSGGTMPVAGGAILAFARLHEIVHIDPDNLRARVEPGVVNADFQEALKPFHLFFAPDPGSHRISTLGGNMSENSGGPHCVKYGVTTNHVLGGTCYLADGTRLELPSTRDWRANLDWTGLVTGSEGTLALLGDLEVQVLAKPPAVETLLATFDNLDRATEAVSAMIRARITPSTLELLDKVSIETVERFAHAGYPQNAQAVLLIEVDGTAPAATAERLRVEEILKDLQAISISRAATAEEVELLWKGRRSAYGAAAQVAGHIWVQDVTVPRPLLPQMMRTVNAIGKRHRLNILIIAHAGDGNLHPNIPYNPADPEEVERMHLADREILEACVALGGSITGEHGIGIDKLEHLALMYGPRELETMWHIKEVFDPSLQLNPFKAVLAPQMSRHVAPSEEVSRFEDPRLTELRETIRNAGECGQRLTIQGTGSRGIAPVNAKWLSSLGLNQIVEIDEGNLTVTVEPGVRARHLKEALTARGLELPSLPHLDHSLGGLIATNRRHWAYSGLGWRDHVLMVEMVDGGGRWLQFGRKTMKNVAGFDVTKLLVGSWGQLGLLTRVVCRLRPLAATRMIGRIESEDVASVLRFSALCRGYASPPNGILVRHSDHCQAFLLVAGTDTHFRQEEFSRMGAQAGLAIVWQPADEVEPEVDQWHEEAVQAAIVRQQYWEGGVLPGQLEDHVDHGDVRWLYPLTGAIEVTQSQTLRDDQWITRRWTPSGFQPVPDPAWDGLEQGIRNIFDPHHIFSKGCVEP